MLPQGVLEYLMGPLGLLVASLYVNLRLWSELHAARAKAAEGHSALLEDLLEEKRFRLQDAHEAANALLQMQDRVTRAVELQASRPCLAGAFRAEPIRPDMTDRSLPTIGGPSNDGTPRSGAT